MRTPVQKLQIRMTNVFVCIVCLTPLLLHPTNEVAFRASDQNDAVRPSPSSKPSLDGSPKRTGIVRNIDDNSLAAFIPPDPYGSREVVTSTLIYTTATSMWSPPSPDPAGITYISTTDGLLISDSKVDETILFTGDNIYSTTLSGTLIDTANGTWLTNEPTGVSYNLGNGHFFFSDDDHKRIYEVDPGFDGRLFTSDDISTYFRTSLFECSNPEGIVYDHNRGHLFIIDGEGEEVFEIEPGLNGIFDGVMPDGDDTLFSTFDVAVMGIVNPEGIAYNPVLDHLYILSNDNQVIAETDMNGLILRYIDLPSSISFINPAGLTYAPSSLNPLDNHIYLVDRGVSPTEVLDENDGMLYEISFPNYEPPVNQPPMVDAGTDQVITLPNSAVLDGTVSDDDLPSPPGMIITTWSMVSGPGIVAFGNPSHVDTTADFSSAGTYVLKLEAYDGELTDHDTLTVIVNPGFIMYLPLLMVTP